MSKVTIAGNASGTGVFTITSPNSNTDRTLTLPDNTGTLLTSGSTFAGTGPSFSASQTNAQTISRTTFTKLQYNIEDWDTASCYDNSTNYRFTPNVAGYYQVNARMQFSIDAVSKDESFISIYKNGSTYKRLTSFGSPANSYSSPGGSVLVYMNGSTDYIEAYVYYGGGSATSAINAGGGEISYFQASLVRAA